MFVIRRTRREWQRIAAWLALIFFVLFLVLRRGRLW